MGNAVIGMLKVIGHQAGAPGIREDENVILSLFGYIFRAQGERIKKMSSLEENFITLAEQFCVLVWPFGKIGRKSKNGTKPVDPQPFPSHPCFSFLLLPALCPQLEPFGKII